MASRMGGPLEDEDFYHGMLPREDLNELLREKGHYLVRRAEMRAGDHQTVISVCIGSKTKKKAGSVPRPVLKHFVLQTTAKGEFTLDHVNKFTSVDKLLDHYRSQRIPLSKGEPEAIIETAVCRQDWELRQEDIELKEKIGAGAFGEVWAGTLRLHTGRRVAIAAKRAKEGVLTKDKLKEMMKEARLMRSFDHRNVVKMYGVVIEREPLMIVMELIQGGSLDTYLRSHEVSLREKNQMVMDAALGVCYLHAKKCIHRDLAARNCLYTTEKILKISDFGLSKEGAKYLQRENTKWMAPESIETLTFSPRSDVWSFGILVWEIYSNAAEPWGHCSNVEARDKVRMLEEEMREQVLAGEKMDFPEGADPEVARLVRRHCWVKEPRLRVTMQDMSRIMHISPARAALMVSATMTAATGSSLSRDSNHSKVKTDRKPPSDRRKKGSRKKSSK